MVQNYYILHYFYVPEARWMGGRCYSPDQAGLAKAVDDFLRIAAKHEIGAVTIHEPGGALLWQDWWIDLPFARLAYHVKAIRKTLATMGGAA